MTKDEHAERILEAVQANEISDASLQRAKRARKVVDVHLTALRNLRQENNFAQRIAAAYQSR